MYRGGTPERYRCRRERPGAAAASLATLPSNARQTGNKCRPLAPNRREVSEEKRPCGALRLSRVDNSDTTNTTPPPNTASGTRLRTLRSKPGALALNAAFCVTKHLPTDFFGPSALDSWILACELQTRNPSQQMLDARMLQLVHRPMAPILDAVTHRALSCPMEKRRCYIRPFSLTSLLRHYEGCDFLRYV